MERAKNRAKKFQKPLKAKDIPAAIKTPKLAALEDEARRRKEQARAAALAKLGCRGEGVPAAAEVKHGHGTSDSASKKKQWSFKPAPMKPVPDFDALHDKFFRKLRPRGRLIPRRSPRSSSPRERRQG